MVTLQEFSQIPVAIASESWCPSPASVAWVRFLGCLDLLYCVNPRFCKDTQNVGNPSWQNYCLNSLVEPLNSCSYQGFAPHLHQLPSHPWVSRGIFSNNSSFQNRPWVKTSSVWGRLWIPISRKLQAQTTVIPCWELHLPFGFQSLPRVGKIQKEIRKICLLTKKGMTLESSKLDFWRVVFEEIPICFPSFNLSFNQNCDKKPSKSRFNRNLGTLSAPFNCTNGGRPEGRSMMIPRAPDIPTTQRAFVCFLDDFFALRVVVANRVHTPES